MQRKGELAALLEMILHFVNQSFRLAKTAYKPVSHAINSHVLTSKTPCINQAIHMLLMHNFCTLHIHILAITKIDIIKSNVHRNECKLVMLG